MMEPHLK